MDAGLRDDAAKAKSLLINEVQRGDMARGGQTVSPDLKAKGDERIFKGAKVAIERGLLYSPRDLDPVRDQLTPKQIEELEAMFTAKPASTLETMIPLTPTPNLSTTADTIGSIPEFQPAGSPPAAAPWSPDMLETEGPGWGGGAIPQGIADWFRDNVDIGFGPGPTDGRAGVPGNGRTPIPPSLLPEGNEDMPPSLGGLPPDMGLPMPGFGSPSLGGQLADDRLAGSPVAPPPSATGPEAPAGDPIIELAATAGSKSEALAIADEAEASGLFPGARAKVMKAFGWDEEGAQNFGRALMGFGSGLLQGGPDFGAALGAGFAKGADEFVNAKDDRRQAALDDRRIAMEDDRLDMAREEMNNKRKQAALDRLAGEAAATESGLIYYEDSEGRIRSRKAPLQEGPQDEESRTDLDRLAQWIIMDEGPAKDALGRKWGFLPKEATADPLLLPAA